MASGLGYRRCHPGLEPGWQMGLFHDLLFVNRLALYVFIEGSKAGGHRLIQRLLTGH